VTDIRSDVQIEEPGSTADTGDTGDTVDTGDTGVGKHLGWALVLISIAQLMVVLDGTIVNIALPYIQILPFLMFRRLKIDPRVL
jgi:hypothetical protein